MDRGGQGRGKDGARTGREEAGKRGVKGLREGKRAVGCLRHLRPSILQNGADMASAMQ